MRPDGQARRQAIHLHQEEHRQDQGRAVEGVEGDARDVSKEQETLPREIPQKEPGGDGDIDGQEKVQPHTLFEEEERTEERDQAEGDNLQPVDNSEPTARFG